MTHGQRHSIANAIQVLEALVTLRDTTPAEFFQQLRDQAQRLRGALEEDES
jgi:hypothetical protein